MAVILFPKKPFARNENPSLTDPSEIMADAISRLNLLMAVYFEPGPSPTAENVLTAVNRILEEPAVCVAAGIERLKILQREDT